MAFDITLVQNPGGGRLPEPLQKRVAHICKAEEIPEEGITIMGGNPYINVTGLDNKVRRRAEREGLVFSGCVVEPVSVPEGDRREFKGTVTYFDAAHFTEAVKGVSSPDAIEALRKAFTYTYSDVGSCSLKTAKMSTMQNADNIAMLASRRASNRAKRAATGVGLTSLDEVMGEPQGKSTLEVRPAKVSVVEEPPPDAGEAADAGSDEPVASPPPAAPAPPPPSQCISTDQGKRVWAKLYDGLDRGDKSGKQARMDAYRAVLTNHGIAHTEQIPKAKYDAICAAVEQIAAKAKDGGA